MLIDIMSDGEEKLPEKILSKPPTPPRDRGFG
jgi:hypothetical protein